MVNVLNVLFPITKHFAHVLLHPPVTHPLAASLSPTPVENLLTVGEASAVRMVSVLRSAALPHLANVGRLVLADSADKNVPALSHVPRDIFAKVEPVCLDVLETMTVQTKNFVSLENVRTHVFWNPLAVQNPQSAESQTTDLSVSAPRDCKETPRLNANALNAELILNVNIQRVVLRVLV